MTTKYRAGFRSPGFATAILGPDGSGKTTLLEALPKRCAPLGGQDLCFHLFPPIATSGDRGTPVTDPHAKPPRGLFSSIAKLFYLVVRYNLGWLASIWLPYRHSTMIWFDRYYHDMLADSRRYRMAAPAWMVRLFGRLIPKPDLFLILDVAPEVARARKVEVAKDESERQFHAYRALARALPNAVLVDANRSPEDVVAACEKAIVEAMAQRVKRRIGRR